MDAGLIHYLWVRAMKESKHLNDTANSTNNTTNKLNNKLLDVLGDL